MCFLCSTEKNKQCFVYLYIFVSESKCVWGGVSRGGHTRTGGYDHIERQIIRFLIFGFTVMLFRVVKKQQQTGGWFFLSLITTFDKVLNYYTFQQTRNAALLPVYYNRRIITKYYRQHTVSTTVMTGSSKIFLSNISR